MFQFEEAVQYVINGYPNSPIEDLKGDVSLLTALSTPLAVTVVRSYCSDMFSLEHVPGLMLKEICPLFIMIVIIPLLHSSQPIICQVYQVAKSGKSMCEKNDLLFSGNSSVIPNCVRSIFRAVD